VSTSSLWQFFFEEGALDEPAVVKLEADAGMGDVNDQLRKVTAAGFADGVRSSMAESLKGLLATPLEDIIGGAWGKYRELLKYCDKTKHPPDEISTVPLLAHTIESTHKPHLDILIDGVRKGRVDFTARVALTIESATLKIRDGRIWEIRTGACKAEGSLKCGPELLIQKQSKPIALPGTLEFAAGVPINPEV
jgi:hypothetical protein